MVFSTGLALPEELLVLQSQTAISFIFGCAMGD